MTQTQKSLTDRITEEVVSIIVQKPINRKFPAEKVHENVRGRECDIEEKLREVLRTMEQAGSIVQVWDHGHTHIRLAESVSEPSNIQLKRTINYTEETPAGVYIHRPSGIVFAEDEDCLKKFVCTVFGYRWDFEDRETETVIELRDLDDDQREEAEQHDVLIRDDDTIRFVLTTEEVGDSE